MAAAVKTALFVLRGRPGLGHIIPGLALALSAWRQGMRIVIATYAQGYEFLRHKDELDFDYELVRLTLPEHYHDWPGLCPYDNGVQELLPLVRQSGADVCFFGGEYIIGPLLNSLDCKSVSLFNPEILIDTPKNRGPSAYLCRMIAQSDYVMPLAPIPRDQPLIAEMPLLEDKIITTGPFVFSTPDVTRSVSKPLVLIANGGGIEFPADTDSYSSAAISPEVWVRETYDYTWAAIEAALDQLKGDGEIHVYSCLQKSQNQALQSLASPAVLQVNSVSPVFYRYLPQADLVISRSGIGFLADIEGLDSYKIIWALHGHDEQIQNAKAFVQRDDKARYCDAPHSMPALLQEAQQGWDGWRRQPPPARDHADHALSELLKCM